MKQPVDSTLPRVAFDFIVKRDIEIFVWFVVKVRISISSVGALHEAPAFKKITLCRTTGRFVTRPTGLM